MFVKNNNGLNGPHCVFCCFLFFFFPLLIHISDSGRGKLKSAVHCGVTSCLHWTGMKPCMVCEVHLYFQGPPAQWGQELGAAPSLPDADVPCMGLFVAPQCALVLALCSS